MYRFIVGVIIGALTYAVFCGEVRSDVDRELVTPEGTSLVGYDMAPVQVDIHSNRSISEWDCYPSNAAIQELNIVVYLNLPAGVAIYNCTLVRGIPKMPLPPNNRFIPIGYSQ